MSVISFRNKFSYGLGSFAWAAKDTSFHYFLFFYYTQFLGLSASLAGLAALLALIADGVSDPIIGQVSDSWKAGKWGRRHPFMIIAIVPFAVSLLAIFNPPQELSQSALFAWYLTCAILVRSFLTLFTVPHSALGAELSDDYEERTSIAVFRNVLGYCGGLSIQVIAWFVLIPAAAAAGMVANGYRNVGYVAAAIAVIGMIAAVMGTRERIDSLVQTSSEQQSRPWYYAFLDMFTVLKLHSARTVLCANLVMVTIIGVGSTMLLHVNHFFYGFSAEQTGIFMLCIFLSLMPASWLAMQGTRLFGKSRAVVWLILAMALVGPMPVMGHLYGLTPENGSFALLAVICTFVVIHQAFYIGSINIMGSMIPDIADEIALSSGRRQEGLINSALMLTQKVTFGMGAFIAGLTIDFVGFDGVTDISQVTETMTTRLAWVYGPGLMCATFLVAYIYSRYRLSRERMAEIGLELAQDTA